MISLAWDSGTSVYGAGTNTIAEVEVMIANLALARIAADLLKATSGEDTPSSRQAIAVFAATRDELLRDYDFNFATRRVKLALNSLPVTAGEWAYAYDIPNTTAFNILKVVEVGANVLNLYEAFNRQIHCNVQSAAEASGITVSSVAITSGLVTVADVTNISEGRPVVFTALTGGAGLTVGTVYWVRDLDLTAKTFKLAATPGGAAIVTSSAGSSTMTLKALAYLDTKVVLSVVDPGYWDSLFKDAFVLRIASKMAVPLTKRADLAQFLQGEFAAILSLAKNASSKESQTDEAETPWTQQRGATK